MGFIGIYDLEHDSNRNAKIVKISDTTVNNDVEIRNAEDAYLLIETIFSASNKSEEFLYLICCNTKLKVNNVFIVSQGCVNWTMVNMKGIFARALLSGAAGIVILHNHPSGDCGMSDEDIKTYKNIQKMCNIMELDLLDYVVIGKHSYSSALEKFGKT